MAGVDRSDFWSRRKAAVEAEAEAERLAIEAAAEAEETALLEAERANKSDAELLEELGLPDPETLTQGDDFAAFMGKHIPEHLRRRALRRLWVSNPVLANLDGLLDHAEDFSDAATSAGTVASAYRVGRGMLKHIEALAASAEQTASGTAEGEDETIEDGIAEGEANREVDAADQAIALSAAEVSASEPVEEQPMPRRHMRFAFAD